jgi:DNA-binding transcriptional LysR family regulator
MLDPRRLLTFRAVARAGSFSRAAEALALSQPAVSQQVAALERELGARLLDRGRGGPRPTPAGERLLGHADALADRLALADAQMAEEAGAAASRLRVGGFPSVMATVVPDALARLLARRPDVEIAAVEGGSDELAAGVRAGRLNVAVCFQDAAAPERRHDGTRRRNLVDEPFVVALPPRHRLARRRRIRLADLAEDRWTAPSRDGMVVRACRAAGFEPRVAFVASDPLAIRALVAGGLSVTLTPRLLADRLEGVRCLPLDADGPRRTLYALAPDRGARPLDLLAVDALAAAARGAAAARPRAG